MKLNLEQQNIVDSIFGAYLINAPVGTGKTTVLTNRIMEAIKGGIRPDQILALTFTNRAADEMRSRIKEMIDDKNDFDSLSVSTFHSFCANFLRLEATKVGIQSDFVILDDDEQFELVKSILSDNNKIYIENKRDALNILEDFYKYRLSLFQIDIGHNVKTKDLSQDIISFGNIYLEKLKEQNAFDFNELVLKVLELLFKDKEVNDRWSQKYKFIQLDEFQDTHISEYLVIKELAKKHKNISLIGDIDQTIYSFRDSKPIFIAKLFKEHFKPVNELSLSINYRSNPELIKVFTSVLANMEDAQTKNLSSDMDSLGSDKCLNLFRGYNFKEEVLWVVDNIEKIRKVDKKSKIAVLTRSNGLVNKAATVFENKGISFLTVDQYDFFRRQEIKDVFAHLKILFNKSDMLSAKRVIERPAKNIGEETLKKIEESGRSCGLNISDFLNFKNYNFKEPFFELLSNYRKGRIIVFDTETTGINPAKDDIVQIYAREIIDGKPGKEFHHYLKTGKSVASSYFVHKISDEFLREKGDDAKKVLLELKDFIGGSIVSGHNVIFDINMVRENSKRYGIDFEFNNYYDTLILARRFLNFSSYKLGNIAKSLGFASATHSADDDVAATIDLLFFLIDKLEKGETEREVLWNKFKSKFITLSSSINNWEQKIDKLKPADFLSFVWEESGLKDYYKKDKISKQRERSYETLKSFFESRYDSDLDNRAALSSLIHYASLVKNIDFLGVEGGKIPIVTIHQVKGLEFDHVFLLGLNEGIFPFFKTDNIEEEKRLFYVALTRARSSVYISYSNFSDNDYAIKKSSLLSNIDPKFINNY
ncbi:MAG: 3'-5' exonuclease [Patescibacteria group bacterium]